MLAVAFAAEARPRVVRRKLAAKVKAVARPPAASQPAAPSVAPGSRLERATRFYQEAAFAAAITLCDDILAQSQDLHEREQARLLMAENYLALGNDAKAELTVRALLDENPDYDLPSLTSPSVRAFFQGVRAGYKIVPVLTHNAPSQVDGAVGVTLRANIKRMRPAYTARLYYRHRGDAGFQHSDLSRGDADGYGAVLPPSFFREKRAPALEYYFEVLDAPGAAPLTHLHDADDPFSVAVSLPAEVTQGAPLYKKWWFWTVIGVVAAGGATTAVVLVVRANEPQYGNASVGLHF